MKSIFYLGPLLFVAFMAHRPSYESPNYGSPSQQTDFQESKTRGREIYLSNCASCHMTDGEGIEGVFPPLSESINLKNTSYVVKTIKNGLSGPIKVKGVEYNSTMLAIDLKEEQITDVVNYIRNSWGNSYGMIDSGEAVE